jgi:hypothetical protein
VSHYDPIRKEASKFFAKRLRTYGRDLYAS